MGCSSQYATCGLDGAVNLLGRSRGHGSCVWGHILGCLTHKSGKDSGHELNGELRWVMHWTTRRSWWSVAEAVSPELSSCGLDLKARKSSSPVAMKPNLPPSTQIRESAKVIGPTMLAKYSAPQINHGGAVCDEKHLSHRCDFEGRRRRTADLKKGRYSWQRLHYRPLRCSSTGRRLTARAGVR